MMNQIQLSGDAIAGIVWFIIFIIWGIGKFIASLREQKIRREYDQKSGEAESEGPGMEDQLRGFLEALTGEELPRSRPTAPPPPPPVSAREPQRASPIRRPAPSADRASGISPFERAQRAVRHATEQQPRRTYNPLLDDAGTVAGKENVVRRLEGRAALPGHEYMLGTRNDGLRLPMFDLRLPHPDKSTNAVYRYHLQGNKGLRRAMIDRVVLGPPRGASRQMPCEDQRQV